MSDRPTPVGAVLRQARKRAGLTQVEMAHRYGTTQSGISRIERSDDVHVSTVVEWLNICGGTLVVSAHGIVAAHPFTQED